MDKATISPTALTATHQDRTSSQVDVNWTHLFRLSVITCVAILAACAEGPSESDIKAALSKSPSARVGAGLGPGFLASDIRSVRKIQCKSDSEKRQRCEVELEAQNGVIVMKTTSEITLVSANGGWKLDQ